MSIKAEKNQLDLSKLLIIASRETIVFEANQNILIKCYTEKQNKNNSKKRFVRVTEK